MLVYLASMEERPISRISISIGEGFSRDTSTLGMAVRGSRYREVAEAFQSNGVKSYFLEFVAVATNVCLKARDTQADR